MMPESEKIGKVKIRQGMSYVALEKVRGFLRITARGKSLPDHSHVDQSHPRQPQ